MGALENHEAIKYSGFNFYTKDFRKGGMRHKTLTAETKNALLDILKREGALDAEYLGQKLQITAMAVRQHLYALQEEGLIQWESQAKGRGRPKKLWSLTNAAEHIFPDAHQDLALDLISAIQKLEGGDVMAKLLGQRGAQQIKRYCDAMAKGKTLQDKLNILAEIRSHEGYMADSSSDGAVHFLHENHCPICAAATACSGICANELEVFQKALGNDVRVSRDSHIISGARRCSYRIEAK